MQFARTFSRTGTVHKLKEEFELADSAVARARGIVAKLVEVNPLEPKYVRELAWLTYLLGNALSDPRRKDRNLEDAQARYDDALALYRKLITAQPSEPDYPIDMAQCYISLSSLCNLKGDHATAIGYLRDALKLQQKVAASHPTVTLYLLDVTSTYYNLGYQFTQISKLDDAVRSYQESIAVAERLVELDREDLDFQDQLGRATCNLGHVLGLQGKNDQALAAYRKAIDIHRPVLKKAPNLPRYCRALLIALSNVSGVMNDRALTGRGRRIRP